MENEDLKPDKQERLRLEWSWRKKDGTVEYFPAGERRAAKENLVLRFEFMDASLAAKDPNNPETWKVEDLKDKFRQHLNLPMPEDEEGKAANRKKTKGKDGKKVSEEGEPEKEVKIQMAFREAPELAATAMVATVMVNPSEVISSHTIDQLVFSDLHVNIKREPYLGKKAKIFKSLIEIKGETYTVIDKAGFIEAIQKEYILAGHIQMHPFVTAAIKQVIEKPLSVFDGIPGLHAEVLAVNSELFVYFARLALVVYKAIVGEKPTGQIPRQLTQEEFTRLETEFNNQLQLNEMLVFTHKIGKKQMQSLNKGQGKITTERFAACKNCTNILKQFCNVKIQTGVTQ